MNSDPLSESIPRMGNGNSAATCSMASKTQMAALFLTDRLTVHPVAMSVTVRVKQNSPLELPPSWPTRSISTNPGRSSLHSAQVRIGIWDLSNDGLVWERPRNINLARSVTKRRSMVAALMEIKRAASASLISKSPSLRNSGTTVASIGARRLPAGQRHSAQQVANEVTTGGVNLDVRGARGLTTLTVPAPRRAALA